MPKKCEFHSCYNNQFGGGFCKWHQYLRKGLVTRVRPVSQRFGQVMRLYYKLAKQFVIDNPFCQIGSPVCTKKSQGVHHPRGRLGKHLLNITEWFSACNACNGYCEKDDAWARENGFKKSRLAKK